MRVLSGVLLLAAVAGSSGLAPPDGRSAIPLLVRPAAGAAAAPPTSEAFAAGVAGFLEWAHPAAGDCAAVERIEVVTRWETGLRVRFEVPCGSDRQVLGAVLETREGAGVWQVSSGFEMDEGDLQAALRRDLLHLPREGGAPPPERGLDPDRRPDTRKARGIGAEPAPAIPPAVSPPPANGTGEARPLEAVNPPVARRQTPPVFPEQAGRARMIGDARVELLVDVTAEGTPARSRVLRGPDPDLGMREAAMAAVRGWGFAPATLAGRAVRYFVPIEITFAGLPPESRRWSHRALFDLQALGLPSESAAEAAATRLRRGESLDDVAPESALDSDWGLTPAASLPAPLRKALHEAMIGAWTGPVKIDGLFYMARKRGEVYYAILPQAGTADMQYQIVHQRGIPDGDEMRGAIDADILDFAAERHRRVYMNEAARLMGLQQTRTEVGQLVIHTDALSDDEVGLLGRVVNGAFRAHQDFWAGITTLRLFHRPVMVYAFRRRSDHLEVQQSWLGRRVAGTPAPVGEYLPASRILAFPCESIDGHLPVPTAIHEAIHMLDFERVYKPRARPSRWFEEGLAEYFGYSQIGSDLRLSPGSIRRSATIVAGTVKVQFDPRAELLEHLRRVEIEGPVPLRRLIEAGPEDGLWSGESSGRAYGAAWTLVHFLLHGDHGRHADAFRRYAALEAGGEGGPEAFRRLVGPDLDLLETTWHRYEETL